MWFRPFLEQYPVVLGKFARGNVLHALRLPLLVLFMAFGAGCSPEATSVAASPNRPTIQAESSTATSMPTALPLTTPTAEPTEQANEATEQATELAVAMDDFCGAEELNEIRIGVLIPQSGSGAVQAGEAMRVAFEIANAEINEAGGPLGKPLRLFIADTAGEPETGRAAAEKLVMENCVSGFVGIYHSRVGLHVKEVAHRYGVPIIFAEPFNDAITSVKYPEVFRIAPTLSMAIESDATWLGSLDDYNDDGVLSTTIIVENAGAGNMMRAEASAERFAKSGIRTEIFGVDLPTLDFSSLIARIVELEHIPDVILIRFNNGAGHALHRQLLDAGIGPQKNTLIVVRQSALNTNSFWEKMPDGVLTVVSRVGPWMSTVGEQGRAFAAAYGEEFDRWPESYAFAAYDSLHILADAIARAETVAPKELILALEETDIELASGRYCFPYGSRNRPNGLDVPDYMWHQWPDPALLYLQYTEQGQDAANVDVLWSEVYRTVDTPIPSNVLDELQKIESCSKP